MAFIRIFPERREVIDVEYEDLSNIEDDHSDDIEDIKELEDEQFNLD